jgi:hypothetical protein
MNTFLANGQWCRCDIKILYSNQVVVPVPAGSGVFILASIIFVV